MVMAIGSQANFNVGEMRAQMQKMESFKEGSSNLSKDDLTTMQSDMESKGITTPEDLKAIIEAYDQIDANGDGMSVDELNAFAEENGIELKGPFGDKPPPPGGGEGPPPPPGGGKGQGSGSGMNVQGSNDINSQLQSLISNYLNSDPQETTSNFSIVV